MAIDWNEYIDRDWRSAGAALEDDYDHLARQLARRGIDIAAIQTRAAAFTVAVPSWGVSTGGTRFARFPGPGEPRNVFEKLDDCHVINRLVCITPGHLAAHSLGRARRSGRAQGLRRRPRARPSARRIRTRSRTSPARRCRTSSAACRTRTRPSASRPSPTICTASSVGLALGARAHSVWIGDGGNFPGQQHVRRALDRYLEQPARDLRAPAAGLAPVHRAQALRARLLLDGPQRLGRQLLTAPASSGTARSRWWTSAITPRT